MLLPRCNGEQQNFATTISPWIVSIHALEEFACPGYHHDPPLLPYLHDPENTNFDIPLTVALRRKCTLFPLWIAPYLLC